MIVLVVFVATGSVAVRQKSTPSQLAGDVHPNYCFCESVHPGHKMTAKSNTYQVKNGFIQGHKCTQSSSCMDCASWKGRSACCEVTVATGSVITDDAPAAGTKGVGQGTCGPESVSTNLHYSDDDVCICKSRKLKAAMKDEGKKHCLPGTPCHVCDADCNEVLEKGSRVEASVSNEDGGVDTKEGIVTNYVGFSKTATVQFSDETTAKYKLTDFRNGDVRKVCEDASSTNQPRKTWSKPAATEATPTGPSSSSPVETGGTAATPRSHKVTDGWNAGVKKQWEGAQGFESKGRERAADTGTGGGVAGRYDPRQGWKSWDAETGTKVESSDEAMTPEAKESFVANHCFCKGGGGTEGQTWQVLEKNTPANPQGQVTGRKSKTCDTCEDCAFGSNPCCNVVVGESEDGKQQVSKGQTCGGPVKRPNFRGEMCSCPSAGGMKPKESLYDPKKPYKCQPEFSCNDCSSLCFKR